MFELKIGRSGASAQEEENEKVQQESKCTFVYLRKIFEGVSDIVSQAEIKVTFDGLYIQAMDTMHVSMVDIFLKSASFESFRCDKEIMLGVPLPYILKIFRSLSVDETSSVLLSAEDEATDLNIVCEDANSTKKYSYKLKLLDLKTEEYNVPNLEHDVTIELSSAELQRITKTLGAFGDVLCITATEKGVLFTQKSDVGDSEAFFSLSENIDNIERKEFTATVLRDASVSIPYKYLAIFGKFSALSTNVMIGLSSNAPLYISTSSPMKHLRYYIAPRLDE